MNSVIVDELRHEANAKLDLKRKGALNELNGPGSNKLQSMQDALVLSSN